jgi:hypothetical protein
VVRGGYANDPPTPHDEVVHAWPAVGGAEADVGGTRNEEREMNTPEEILRMIATDAAEEIQEAEIARLTDERNQGRSTIAREMNNDACVHLCKCKMCMADPIDSCARYLSGHDAITRIAELEAEVREVSNESYRQGLQDAYTENDPLGRKSIKDYEAEIARVTAENERLEVECAQKSDCLSRLTAEVAALRKKLGPCRTREYEAMPCNMEAAHMSANKQRHGLYSHRPKMTIDADGNLAGGPIKCLTNRSRIPLEALDAKACTGKPRLPRKPVDRSLEDAFALQIATALQGYPARDPIRGWVTQYKFHPTRQWHADIAFPALMIIVEIEGGIWSGGRHVRGQGFEDDCVKYNTAESMGWHVIRLTAAQVHDGRGLEWLVALIELKTKETK